MALPPLELPPIEKGRPVAGRPFCFVENVVFSWEKWTVLGDGEVVISDTEWDITKAGGAALDLKRAV
jgi:hypothetical protein